MKADRLSAEESKRYLNIALRQGNKVRSLSQQLFELARLEHGGIKLQPEKFVLAELVQDVAQKFDLAIATRHHPITALAGRGIAAGGGGFIDDGAGVDQFTG